MVRFGVISDIHSHRFEKNVNQGGYYYPNMPELPEAKNPFSALKGLFRKERIRFDFLVCPGDLAHKMDYDGLKSSWDQLKLIKSDVDANLLIATIGNHDVKSRDRTGSPFEFVKNFDLDFPVYSSTDCTSYKRDLLDKGYFLIDDLSMDVLIVVVNSCFDHWDDVSASKGKVNLEYMSDIKDSISKSERKVKVGLIHHHPIIHETGIYDTHDVIEGCDSLMKLLEGLDLIVHGHKHDFRFTQNRLYPKNQNILSAGSFSCYSSSRPAGTLNYFHLIEFHDEVPENCQNPGIILTYSYDLITGWNREKGMDEGFGCVSTVNEIEEAVKNEISKRSEKYFQWNEIMDSIPKLKYVSRKTTLEVLDSLETKGVIKRFNINRGVIGDVIIG